MYLPFENKQFAEERNLIEALRRGCDLSKTRFYWSFEFTESEAVYLDVGDGEGLTEEEKLNCVESIP